MPTLHRPFGLHEAAAQAELVAATDSAAEAEGDRSVTGDLASLPAELPKRVQASRMTLCLDIEGRTFRSWLSHWRRDQLDLGR